MIAAMSRLPSPLPKTTMRRCAFSRWIWFGPSVSSTSASSAQRHMAGRRRDQEIAKAGGGAVLVGKPHHHVEAAVAFDDLRHPAAVRQRFQRLAHRRRRHAVERRALVVDLDADLRNQHLLLDLQVDQPGDAGELLAQRLRQPPQRVEVVAVDLQRDLRAHAGQQVVEPVRDRLADIDRHRQHRQPRADVGVDLFLRTRRADEVDVELAEVHAFGMLVELGAAGAAADAISPRAPARRCCSAMKPSRCDSASEMPGLYWTVTSSVPSLNGGRKLRGSRYAAMPATTTAAATDANTAARCANAQCSSASLPRLRCRTTKLSRLMARGRVPTADSRTAPA